MQFYNDTEARKYSTKYVPLLCPATPLYAYDRTWYVSIPGHTHMCHRVDIIFLGS